MRVNNAIALNQLHKMMLAKTTNPGVQYDWVEELKAAAKKALDERALKKAGFVDVAKLKRGAQPLCAASKECRYIIYALIDPRDNEIRYIGQAQDSYKRQLAHNTNFKNLGKVNDRLMFWFLDMQIANVKPLFKVLELCRDKNLLKRENYWIEFGAKRGWMLCNVAQLGKYAQKLREMEFPEEVRLKESYRRLVNNGLI